MASQVLFWFTMGVFLTDENHENFPYSNLEFVFIKEETNMIDLMYSKPNMKGADFMDNNERINEIISKLTALAKKVYKRAELLPELIKLEHELIYILYNEKHANLAELKIWDVERYLIQLNEEKGNIAKDELDEVLKLIRIIKNLISSEISGTAGEKKAFWALQKICGRKRILKNVEFTDSEDHRTELDAVLLLPKAIFLIEVKGTKKDILIDEHGNYCRVTNTIAIDKNIGERMSDKVHLLREALGDAEEARLNIVSMVVFINNDINVENRFPFIRTCFLGELPYIIESYEGKDLYSEYELTKMEQQIKENACEEAYPVPFDVEQFKYKFAALVAKLEEAGQVTDDNEDAEDSEQGTTESDSTENKVVEHASKGKGRSLIVGVVSSVVGFVLANILSIFIKKVKKGE